MVRRVELHKATMAAINRRGLDSDQDLATPLTFRPIVMEFEQL
jgi:hypothetical protein